MAFFTVLKIRENVVCFDVSVMINQDKRNKKPNKNPEEVICPNYLSKSKMTRQIKPWAFRC